MDERLQPIDLAAAWYGRDLQDSDSWIEQLTDVEIAEVQQAVAGVERAGLALLAVDRDQFPLPTLGPRLRALGGELDRGRGFWLLRGLPRESMTKQQAAIAYWGMGRHMGVLVSQNARGHLLGHVTDEGLDIKSSGTRGYQTRVRLPYHTDSSDAVGLLCLQPSRSGGLSSLTSSTTVFNESVTRRPDLAHYWFQDWYYDRRNEHREDEDPFFVTKLATRSGDVLSIRYVRPFLDTALRHDGVPRRTDGEKEFLDLVDSITEEDGIALHMDFQPGDIQFVCNYTIMHSRTAYEDWPDAARRRHLLRLWVSLENGRPLPESFGRGVTEGLAGRGGIAPVPGVAEPMAGTELDRLVG